MTSYPQRTMPNTHNTTSLNTMFSIFRIIPPWKTFSSIFYKALNSLAVASRPHNALWTPLAPWMFYSNHAMIRCRIIPQIHLDFPPFLPLLMFCPSQKCPPSLTPVEIQDLSWWWIESGLLYKAVIPLPHHASCKEQLSGPYDATFLHTHAA